MKRLAKLLFMPCEGISGLASESLDRDLSRTERFGVRVHTLYCNACRRYRSQILLIRKIIRSADGRLSSTGDTQLEPKARRRIVRSIEDATRDS